MMIFHVVSLDVGTLVFRVSNTCLSVVVWSNHRLVFWMELQIRALRIQMIPAALRVNSVSVQTQ